MDVSPTVFEILTFKARKWLVSLTFSLFYTPPTSYSTSNKLRNIYPTLPINSNYPKAQLTRHEQTLYNRLRIGHTYLTHSYLLKDEDPLICIPCNSLLTVEHILISCIDFDIIRQNFYTASNRKDLFHNIHPKRIISFCTCHWPY